MCIRDSLRPVVGPPEEYGAGYLEETFKRPAYARSASPPGPSATSSPSPRWGLRPPPLRRLCGP
eukprot:13231476-Alexandrium_andersonii.AAC.1